jgi:hypothetical protein
MGIKHRESSYLRAYKAHSRSTNVERTLQIHPFMQNKANSNPIKPISNPNKPNSKPKQTQSKPILKMKAFAWIRNPTMVYYDLLAYFITLKGANLSKGQK